MAAALRFGFDAARACRNPTGLGNYARGLLDALATAEPTATLMLYAPGPPRESFGRWLDRLPHSVLRLPPRGLRPSPLRQFWRTFRLGRTAARDGVALYHGLSAEIPRDLPGTGIPSVVTVHDLLFQQRPDLFPGPDRMSYAWRYRWSALRATAVIAVSARTADDLAAGFGVDRERITVIPPIRDPRFAEPVAEGEGRAVRQRLELPERYLLLVGTLERRKNQRLAVAALAQLDPAMTPPLVLVGRDRGEGRVIADLVRRHRLEGRVLVRTAVATADLPAVMHGAAVFLYPSLAEGFGMPIVEALSAGVPVIASAGAPFTEAGGPATRYVSPDDPAGLAEAIRSVVDDPATAEAMREAGRAHARRFDGAVLAGQVLALYHQLLR